MDKRVLRTRCYERQYRLYCQEFPWLAPFVEHIGLDIGHIHNIIDEPLKGSHLDEVVGSFTHPKRAECKARVYALTGQGNVMGPLHPPYAFEQSLFTWAMRTFGFPRFELAWTLRDGILSFIESQNLYLPGARDSTSEARFLVLVTEWVVANKDMLFPCLELKILTIVGNRSLLTIEKCTRLKEVA